MKDAHGDHFEDAVGDILAEVTACASRASSRSLVEAGAAIATAPRIFVAGAGRSGLCMRALGMRLMHLGKTVFVVGETTTPSIGADDLLIIGSGSGEKAGLLALAEQGRKVGASMLLFTADVTSPLAALASNLVVIPLPAVQAAEEGGQRHVSVQPLGTLFEQCLLILSDALVLTLMRQNSISAAQMADRHANLE